MSLTAPILFQLFLQVYSWSLWKWYSV